MPDGQPPAGLLEIEGRDGDKVMLRFGDSWQFKSQSDGGGSQFSLKIEPELRLLP